MSDRYDFDPTSLLRAKRSLENLNRALEGESVRPLWMRLSEVVLGTVAGVAIFVYSLYVDTILWNWFLAPLGLPRIGMMQALGIGLAAAFILGLPRLARQQSVNDLRPDRLKRTASEKFWAACGSALALTIITHVLAILTRYFGG